MTLLKAVHLNSNVHALAFGPPSTLEGLLLLCSTADNSLHSFEIISPTAAGAMLEVSPSSTKTIGIHRAVCEGLGVSTNGKYVATGGNDHMIKVWPLRELCSTPGRQSPPKSEAYVGHSDHVTKLRFSPDGENLVSVGGGDAIFIWEFCGGVGVDPSELVDESLRQAERERSTQLAELMQRERQARDVILTPAQALQPVSSEVAARAPIEPQHLPAELLLPVAVAELKDRLNALDTEDEQDSDETELRLADDLAHLEAAVSHPSSRGQLKPPRKQFIPQRVFADTAHEQSFSLAGAAESQKYGEVDSRESETGLAADVSGLSVDGWAAVEGGGTGAAGLATQCAEGLKLKRLIGFNTHAHDHVLWQQPEGRVIYSSGDTLIVDALQTGAETAYASGRCGCAF